MDLENDSAYDESAIEALGKPGLRRLLVDGAPDGLVAVDTAGTVVFANSAVERILGYEPGEVVGEPLTLLVPEHLHEDHPDSLRDFLATGGDPDRDWVERRGLHRDGHEVALETAFREVQREDVHLFVGHIRDGPDGEGDVAAAGVNETVDRITDAVFSLDDEWRFVYLNEQAERVLDATEADLRGRVIWEAFPDVVGSTFERQYRRAMERQEPVTFEAESAAFEGTWFEVRAYPSESGLSVYFRDVTDRKRYERTLTALHEATQDLAAADSPQEVAKKVVETATDVIDLSDVGVYLFDAAANSLEPVEYSGGMRETVGDLPSIDPGEGIAGRVFLDGQTQLYDDVREVEDLRDPETPLRSGLVVPLGDRGVFVAGSTELGAFDERTRELGELLATDAAAALDRIDRERTLRERDQELERRNRRLERSNRIVDLIRQIDRALVDASTRDEIERAVCGDLVDSDQFALAWVGDADGPESKVVPRTWAGEEQGYFDAALDAGDPGTELQEPGARAATAGEVTVVENVADDLQSVPWRRAALARGFQSVIAVPLAYDGFDYGALAVYRTSSGGLDDVLVGVFRELGETIANAINAVETKRGLLFDRVVELELRIPDPESVLSRIAARADCRVEFEGVVPQSGTSPTFFSTSGADAETVQSVADQLVSVDQVRPIEADGSECLFEVLVTGDSVASAVAEYGGIPRSIVTDGSEVRGVVDLPYTTDVRSFVERLRTRFAGTELVARRERERSLDTRRGFRGELHERLTERQWQVLQAAYLSGYFEEPRRSTGEEIGDALGISQPTFTSHLRAAQRTLFSALLED